jgi:hypothetical protein
MDEKQIELISRQMKGSELLLELVPILCFSSSGVELDNRLGITSSGFYFLYSNLIKKHVDISSIIMVTISAFSQEMVLHTEEDDLRLASFYNAKIFKNILKVR